MIEWLILASGVATSAPGSDTAEPAPRVVIVPRLEPEPEWTPDQGARSPRPTRPPQSWVSAGDYPAAAHRAGASGTSQFSASVAANGRVIDCQTMNSSGSVELDRETCKLVKRRGRFFPARDAEGRKVAGEYQGRIRWSLPPPRRNNFANGAMTLSFTLGPDGVPTDCKSEVTGPSPLGPEAEANRSPCDSLQRFEPFRAPDGTPVARRVRMHLETSVDEQ